MKPPARTAAAAIRNAAGRLSGPPLRRTCERGHHRPPGAACATCAREGLAPAGVRDALRLAGQPLDVGLRASLGARLDVDLAALPTRPPASALRVMPSDDPAESWADRAALRALDLRALPPKRPTPLGDVRIHADTTAARAAASVGARAFTVGRNILFGADAYRPRSADGLALLAHELAHATRADPSRLHRKEIAENKEALALAGPAPSDTAKQDEEETPADRTQPTVATAAAPAAADRGVGTTTPPAGPKAALHQAGPQTAPPQADTAAQAGGVGDLATGDLALIDEELAEHERWGAALQQVGEAGSAERAGFLADEVGGGAAAGLKEGFTQGAAQAIKMKAGMKAAEKLIEKTGVSVMIKLGGQAAKFTPLPAVGAVVGGIFAAIALSERDWSATGEAIGAFGKGADLYEQLANSIQAISTIVEVATAVANVIAGILGGIVVIMWLAAAASGGAIAPVAASLTAAALAIGGGTMALDAINALVLKELITAFRSMHAFAGDADPRDVVKQGDAIAAAAGAVGGFAGGFLGAKAAEGGLHLGDKAVGAAQKKFGAHPEPPAASGEGPVVKADPAPKQAQAGAAGAEHEIEPAALEPTAATAPTKESEPSAADLPQPEVAQELGAATQGHPAVAVEPAASVALEAPAAATPAPESTAPAAATASPEQPKQHGPAATTEPPAPQPAPPEATAGAAKPTAAEPEQLTLPGVEAPAASPAAPPPPAQPPPAPGGAAPASGEGIRPLTEVLRLPAIKGNETVPTGLEPGAIGTYGRAIDQPHPFALESNPPGAPGATQGGGRMPQEGRKAAGVYGEHQTPAAVAHEVLPGHEYHGPAGQRRGGRDTVEALAISFPEAAKGQKDLLDARLLSEVRARKAQGQEVPPIEIIVRGAQHSQSAIKQPGVAVPETQVTKAFLGEMDQFHDPKFGYTEARPGSHPPGGSPLAGASQAEIDAHVDKMFAPYVKTREPQQLELPFPKAASAAPAAPEPSARPPAAAAPVVAPLPAPATAEAAPTVAPVHGGAPPGGAIPPGGGPQSGAPASGGDPLLPGLSDSEVGAAVDLSASGPGFSIQTTADPSVVSTKAATQPPKMELRYGKGQVGNERPQDFPAPPDPRGSYWGHEPPPGSMTVQEWSVNAKRGMPKLDPAKKPVGGPAGNVRTRARIHSPDPNTKPGSPSREGWTMNIIQGDARMLPDGAWFDKREGISPSGKAISTAPYRPDPTGGGWVEHATGKSVTDPEVLGALADWDGKMRASHMTLFPPPRATPPGSPPSGGHKSLAIPSSAPAAARSAPAAHALATPAVAASAPEAAAAAAAGPDVAMTPFAPKAPPPAAVAASASSASPAAPAAATKRAEPVPAGSAETPPASPAPAAAPTPAIAPPAPQAPPPAASEPPLAEPQAKADPTAPILERVKPNYPNPPAAPDDIVSLRNQVVDILAARAEAEKFAGVMAAQVVHHAANEKPVADLQKTTQTAQSATAAHQQAVAHRDEANERKQAEENKAAAKLEDYGARKAKLAALTGPLKLLAGFTGLARGLPDEPEVVANFRNKVLKVNTDAHQFLAKLDEMDKTIETQRAAQAERKTGIAADKATLERTAENAGRAAESFDAAQQTAADFADKNKERKETAKTQGDAAAATAAKLDAQAKQKTAQAVSLAAAMQSWAQSHRQARVNALQATQKRLEAAGWRVTEVREK